jgi:hypothetical protein
MEAQKNEVHNSDSFFTRPTCEIIISPTMEIHVSIYRRM